MSPRLRALLLVPLPLAALAAAAVVFSFRARHEIDRQTEATHKLMVRIDQALERRRLFNRNAAKLDLDGMEKRLFLEAPSQAIAMAGFQQRLSAEIRDAGLRLSSVRVDEAAKSALKTLRLRVNMEGDLESLTRLLVRLERSVPRVRVERLRINRRKAAKVERFGIAMTASVLMRETKETP